MKKYLLPLLLLAAPAFAAQQEITAVPDSPVLPSIGALKDAVNLRLADIDENFDEIYPIIAAGPVYVNASAPSDTKVVWIDTDQSNAIKVRIGEVWTVVGTASEGSYTLPAATDTTLGGVIDGAGVTIAADGTLSADLQAVGDCTASPCLDGSADGGNLIKLWAGTGSYWTALQGGSPAANRSWRLPIAAAPAAGETLVMTMDEYGQMGFLAAPETSGYVLSSTDAGVLSWAAGGSGAGDDLGSAAYSDVVALWTTCTGYLKSDGTCDTPSGSATYPSAAGVANWGGSAWGTSYTVGTGASNLVQLNASAQLPAVSAALLTNFPTLNQNTTGTAGGLSGTPNITVGTISAGAAGFGVDEDGDVTAKSVTVTRTTSPSAIDLYEGTGGGDNKLTLTLSGNLLADATLNADQILVDGDIGSTVQAYDADLTTWAGITPGTGVGAALATPSSANLRAAVTDESGTGVLLFAGGNIGAATSTGAVDFGGATSLEVPNGAAPTVDAAGEIAVDTTSDQLIYYGSAKRVLPHRLQENFAIKSPVDADDVLMFKAQQAITITDIHVLAQGGGTISVDIQECDSAGANCATVDAAISADSDGAEDDGSLSNGAIDAGDWVKLVLAAPSGTVNFLSGSIYYTITAD